MERRNDIQPVWIIRFPDGKIESYLNKKEVEWAAAQYEKLTGKKPVII